VPTSGRGIRYCGQNHLRLRQGSQRCDAQAAPQEPHSGRQMVPKRAPTCTNGPAAEDPQRQAPRPLPVLRPTDELSEPSEVLSGCRKDLEEVAQSPHAREPDDVGEIQTPPSSVSFAVTSDSTSLDVPGESCLRNPLREICTVGSVREEIPVVPWWTYTGTKLETADTAKENLQPIGTPLLGERRSYANNLPTLPLLQ